MFLWLIWIKKVKQYLISIFLPDFGNIKGVMLCNRPNENLSMFKEQFSFQFYHQINQGILFQELLQENNLVLIL